MGFNVMQAYGLRPGGEGGEQELDHIILTLATAVRNIFPGVLLNHVIPKVKLRLGVPVNAKGAC